MSAISRVVAKPVELDAVQFDGSLQNRQFLGGWVRDELTGQSILVGSDKFYLPTPDGTVIGTLGDWVVKGLDGTFSLVRSQRFDTLFSVVPDALEGV